MYENNNGGRYSNENDRMNFELNYINESLGAQGQDIDQEDLNSESKKTLTRASRGDLLEDQWN